MDGPAVHPQVQAVSAEIATMKVRGATTIAETAADALRAQAEESDAATPEDFLAEMTAAARTLVETRPTAVSLPNAVHVVVGGMAGETVDELRESVVTAASDLRARLASAQAELGEIGATRLADGDTIVTHCHSTDAMACVEAVRDQGKALTAYVKETRPRLQGHITARELEELGVSTTLIVDGAARRYLQEADHVLVGADSVQADGSVINKVGTSGLATIATHLDIPVTVAAGSIKLDPASLHGEGVEIEHRDRTEVVPESEATGLGDIDVANPAFDVTPPAYVDAIVTERGVVAPAEVESLIRDLYGDVPVRPWEADGTETTGEPRDATERP